jgi:hypothetical protein
VLCSAVQCVARNVKKQKDVRECYVVLCDALRRMLLVPTGAPLPSVVPGT